MPNAASEYTPIVGVMEADIDDLDSLLVDISAMPESLTADVRATLMGLRVAHGGETKFRDDGTSWVTPDNLQIDWRIDNWEELMLENETDIQYLSIPKMIQRDGRGLRAKPTLNQDYARWLMAWSNIGVADNPISGTEFVFSTIKDLIGIQVRRQEVPIPGTGGDGRRQRSIKIPTELYGFDNELRKAAKLPPAKIKSMG